MSKLGNRANWSVPYVSDAPRDILGLTQAQENNIDQFIGFSGTNNAGEKEDLFILVAKTATITLSDYASVPVGTIILMPLSTTIFCYQRVAKTNGGNADWRQVAKSAVS